MKKQTIVLGAGIAGLAYSYFNKDKENVTVYEKNDYWGGLCHSFKVNGYTFDSAVHLSFTTDERVRQIFDNISYQKHRPIMYNFYNGHWIKHPVIYNSYPLSVDEKTACITSFFHRDTKREICNYADWLRYSYGEVFFEKFYNVYTKKYWRCPADKLSLTWLGNRFVLPDEKYVLQGSYESNKRNDYYANEFRYPQRGNGYQQFLEPLAKDANIKLELKAIELDLKKRYVVFSNGEKRYYDKLVSSIPLPELVGITKDVPEDVARAVSKLKASKISLVSVAFNKADIAKMLSFYIYDEDILAARVNCPSIKCKDNVPEGCSSMQFEIYHLPDEKVEEEKVLENVRYALKKMEICNDDDIEFMDYRLLPYGNVIFELGMEAHRDLVKSYYESMGVGLIGRFGKWDYLWSDQSLLSALEV